MTPPILAQSTFDIGLDLFPLLAAVLASVACGLLGNFLVLRRLSLMGDAISHSVLPGLVIAFLVTATRSPLVMFAGAALAGVATVVLVELVKRFGRVDPGAAMGVVFSVLFALGVLLIEQAAVRHIDLDADCVLHGQLETLAWYGAPDSIAGLFRAETLAAVPRQVTTLLVVCLAAAALVFGLFKELRIAAFDPELATTLGYDSRLLHYVLMVFVAGATVAAFEAVGSILVIAMLICPAATARLLTDRLRSQVAVSLGFAIASAGAGYAAATAVPAAFGRDSVNAAGSITVVAGGLVGGAIILSPRYGVLARAVRQRRLSRTIAHDDLLATLFRAHEEGADAVSLEAVHRRSGLEALAAGLPLARRRGTIVEGPDGLRLTAEGETLARELVRRHRLWEHYLVEQAGLATDHVHHTAEVLEHLEPRPPTGPDIDPQGKPIPSADGR